LEDHNLKFTWAKAGKTKYLKNKLKKKAKKAQVVEDFPSKQEAQSSISIIASHFFQKAF
jgi:hypothetical protein